MNARPAIFLDRDGVLIRDVDLLTRVEDIVLLEDAAASLRELQDRGYKLIVVSNQPVVARGLATEADVERVNEHIGELLRQASGAVVDRFYFCPHHPEADIEEYRIACECRKPRPGMLLKAVSDFDIDLQRSWMIGDRISDVAAGARAGVRTIQLRTGRHDELPIVSPDPIGDDAAPEFVCDAWADAMSVLRGEAA